MLDVCQLRLNHLSELMDCKSPESEEFLRWNKIRIDRIIVDYLLREGFYDSAIRLSEIAEIRNLVDIDLFAKSRKIEDSLRNRSCSECLVWCIENRSKLKKMEVCPVPDIEPNL